MYPLMLKKKYENKEKHFILGGDGGIGKFSIKKW